MAARHSRRPAPCAAGPALSRTALPIAAILLVAALVQAAAYWPGVMIWDAIHQYEQALSGHYTDWHPPILQWLWRRLLPITPGPAPMLVAQLTLYWSGHALLIARALADGGRGRAVAFAAAALLPIPLALMGSIIKDCLMAASLVAAFGLLAWSDRWGWPARIAGSLLLFFAAALRFNGLVAALPPLVALAPSAWRASGARLAAVTIAALIPLALAQPLTTRALHAEKTDVGLSLVIFDLAGITHHGGVDAFPPLVVPDPVAVNARCYTPELWDPYAWWVADPCPIQFGAIRASFATAHRSPYLWWTGAIAAHPIAYAEHRLAHFNINSGFMIARLPTRPVFDATDPNPWGFAATPNIGMRWIDRAARWSALTPLGWPIAWMTLAAGLLALDLPSRKRIVPLALSSLLYGLSYLPLSVAAETRYHLWTMIGASLALAMAIGDVATGARVARRRLLLAMAPLAIVIILGTIARI